MVRYFPTIAGLALLSACSGMEMPYIPYLSSYLSKPDEFSCGTRTVVVEGKGDKLRMTAAGQSYDMIRTVSGSGAHYTADEDPNTVFWKREDGAEVIVAGKEYPPCQLVGAEAANSPMEQLTGAEWVVQDIDGKGVIEKPQATIGFTDEGRVSGKGSCNSYSGEFTLTKTGITFSKDVAATMMACAPAQMDQERRFFGSLSATQSYEIAADGTLVLHGVGGRSITARR